MAMDLISRVKKKVRDAKSNPEDIAIQFVATELKNPAKMTPNDDVLVGRLMHPIKGIEWSTDEQGRGPEVRVRLRKSLSSGKRTFEVFDLSRDGLKDFGSAQYPTKVERDAVIILKEAQYDFKSGHVLARNLEVFSRDPKLTPSVVNKFVSVEPETFFEDDKRISFHQARSVLHADKARKIGTVDEFRSAFEDFLAERTDETVHYSVLLRRIDLDNPLIVRGQSIPCKDMNELEEWLSDPKNSEFVEELSGPGGNSLIEVMPRSVYRTYDREKPVRRLDRQLDDHLKFAIPLVDRDGALRFVKDPTGERARSGYATAIMTIKPKGQTRSGAIREHTSAAKVMVTGNELYTRSDVPTPNLPKEIRELYRERAIERFKANQAARESDIASRKGNEADRRLVSEYMRLPMTVVAEHVMAQNEQMARKHEQEVDRRLQAQVLMAKEGLRTTWSEPEAPQFHEVTMPKLSDQQMWDVFRLGDGLGDKTEAALKVMFWDNVNMWGRGTEHIDIEENRSRMIRIQVENSTDEAVSRMADRIRSFTNELESAPLTR